MSHVLEALFDAVTEIGRRQRSAIDWVLLFLACTLGLAVGIGMAETLFDGDGAHFFGLILLPGALTFALGLALGRPLACTVGAAASGSVLCAVVIVPLGILELFF